MYISIRVILNKMCLSSLAVHVWTGQLGTLCWMSRKGSNMRSPPSWTIHHTSMVPSFRRSWLLGKWSMFFATSRAWWASVVSLTVSAGGAVEQHFRSFLGLLIVRNWWSTFKWGLPIKFLRGREPRACFQAAGQAIRTVLCFIPPSPAAWMSIEKPSRRLEVTTTWEKPFVFSAVMAAFRFYKKKTYIHICKYISHGKVQYFTINKPHSLPHIQYSATYTISHKHHDNSCCGASWETFKEAWSGF